MRRSGPKYQVGDHYFMRVSFKSLAPNDEVVVTDVTKKRKDTYFEVRDINGNIVTDVYYKDVRKRPR